MRAPGKGTSFMVKPSAKGTWLCFRQYVLHEYIERRKQITPIQVTPSYAILHPPLPAALTL